MDLKEGRFTQASLLHRLVELLAKANYLRDACPARDSPAFARRDDDTSHLDVIIRMLTHHRGRVLYGRYLLQSAPSATSLPIPN